MTVSFGARLGLIAAILMASTGRLPAPISELETPTATPARSVTPRPHSDTSAVTDPRLKQFIEDYVQSGNYSTPEVELGFLADPLIEYFGVSGMTRADILADRKRHIEAWPERRYSLQGPPQLLGKEGSDVFVVEAIVHYELLNDKVTPAQRRAGISRQIYRIKAEGSKFKIISVMEAKQE